MVTSDTTDAIAAAVIGEPIWRTPTRTRLSLPAKRKAAANGKSRSAVRHVLAVPRQERETIPATIKKAPSRLVTVGRSPRKKTAKAMANKGVLFVRHAEMGAPSRSIPLKIKKRATPGTKIPMITNMPFAGAQRSIRSEENDR